MKKLLGSLALILLLLAGNKITSAQETARGYFSVNDCGTIFGPTAYRIVCLQLENSPTRTYGNEYQWTGATPRPGDPANTWIQYNGTGGGGGSGTITGVTAGPGLAGGGVSGVVTLSLAPFVNHSVLIGSGTNLPNTAGPGTSGQCFISNGTGVDPSFQACPGGGGGGGSVTSIGLTMPTGFTVSNSPVTTSGVIGVTTTLNGMLKGTGSGFAVATSGTDYVPAGAITTSSLTMSTARLLGRTTAATGAVQEITVGTGLSLATTTLSIDSTVVTLTGTQTLSSKTLDNTNIATLKASNFTLQDATDTTKQLKLDLSGFTTATTRTWSGPNSSTRLLGDSDFSTSGMMARTGPGVYAGRTLTGGVANEFTITNGNGVSGNPTISLGSLAVKNNQANIYTTGDQNMALATSFTPPSATGAAPTASGSMAYDLTTNRFKGGYFNGSIQTTGIFAFSSEVQPLNSNLTALSGLTGVSQSIPTFTGAGTMQVRPLLSCLDSGGQHMNYDLTNGWVCGTSSASGLSGLTTGNFLLATGATSATTSSNLSESAGVVNAAGGLSIGNIGTNKLTHDVSAVTGAKTATWPNSTGTVGIATAGGGAITDTHIVKFAVSGGVITLVDGGTAGTGTWTDSSTNTGTNKTLRDALAGGTGNAIWTPVRVSWDAGSLTADGSLCADPSKVTINSGPTQYVIICSHNTSATIDGQVTLPITMVAALNTVKLQLTVNDVDSSSQHFSGTFKAQCRNNGTAVNSTWGSTQTVDITMTTAQNNYTGTTAAVTPNGTCSAGATLFWRFTITNSGGTDDNGNARVIGVMMEQQS